MMRVMGLLVCLVSNEFFVRTDITLWRLKMLFVCELACGGLLAEVLLCTAACGEICL